MIVFRAMLIEGALVAESLYADLTMEISRMGLGMMHH